MSRTKINIPKRVLEKLYWEEGLSTIKIARIYSCDPMTVINRIRELAIPRKSASQARIRCPRANFSGNVTEKAYMLGLTDGDLNTYTLPGEQTVVARCHTTQEVQVVILEEVFSRYGRVSVSRSESNGFHVNCYLNRTFLFLVTEKKQMPCWLLSSNKTFQSYIAGYTDAEGNFILNQGRARFKIDSYDKKMLDMVIEVLKMKPTKITIVKPVVTDDTATFTVKGVYPSGEISTGSIKMFFEDMKWNIAEDKWKISSQ